MPCDGFELVVRTAIQTDSPPNFCGFSDRDRNVVDLNILQAAKKGFPRRKLQGFQISWDTSNVQMLLHAGSGDGMLSSGGTIVCVQFQVQDVLFMVTVTECHCPSHRDCFGVTDVRIPPASLPTEAVTFPASI